MVIETKTKQEEIQIVLHWLRLTNEFPLEYTAQKIVEALRDGTTWQLEKR